MAKCKYYIAFNAPDGIEIKDCSVPYQRVDAKNRTLCPNNTNAKCEIVTKRKPKYKRVKAWGYRGEDFNEIPGFHCVPEQYDGTFPCYIVAEAKYLKGEK
jgi:hypothetical protein